MPDDIIADGLHGRVRRQVAVVVHIVGDVLAVDGHAAARLYQQAQRVNGGRYLHPVRFRRDKLHRGKRDVNGVSNGLQARFHPLPGHGRRERGRHLGHFQVFNVIVKHIIRYRNGRYAAYHDVGLPQLRNVKLAAFFPGNADSMAWQPVHVAGFNGHVQFGRGNRGLRPRPTLHQKISLPANKRQRKHDQRAHHPNRRNHRPAHMAPPPAIAALRRQRRILARRGRQILLEIVLADTGFEKRFFLRGILFVGALLGARCLRGGSVPAQPAADFFRPVDRLFRVVRQLGKKSPGAADAGRPCPEGAMPSSAAFFRSSFRYSLPRSRRSFRRFISSASVSSCGLARVGAGFRGASGAGRLSAGSPESS